MQCVACDGGGCQQCQGGSVDITDCPLKTVTADVWGIIEAQEFLEAGLAPVAGGLLEQTQSFLDAARFVKSEKRSWENRNKT